MTLGTSELVLSQFSAFLAEQLGLHFPQERWSELQRGLRSAAQQFGAVDMETCAHRLMSSPLTTDQIQILASHLTVGETYFFREKHSLEIFSTQLLPELMRARQATQKHLRIWSAGCCTGEEPYSIAILLDRLFPELDEWRPTILATDINPHFLHKAVTGIFNDWSFRDAPAWLKANYFTQVAEHRFEILPRIKKRVTFAYLNLAQDGYPSLATDTNAMDVIFCRNVLMYFSPERVGKIVAKLHRSLLPGGWLIVSPSELSTTLSEQFAATQFDEAILYRKENQSVTEAAFWTDVPTVQSCEAHAAAQTPAVDATPEGVAGNPVVEPAPRVEHQTSVYRQALALFDGGSYAEATELLEVNVFSAPDSAERLALLARSCANLGKLAEARAWAEQALLADKLNAGLHYIHAIILREQGSDEAAIAALKRALYLSPDFVLAHFALGTLARQQGRQQEADKHLRNALTLLKHCPAGEVLPYSDGLAAERLEEMIQAALPIRGAA